MRASQTIRRRGTLLAGAVLAATVLGWSTAARPDSFLPQPAQRFVAYYKAMAQNPEPLSVWERVTYSFLMANSTKPPPKKKADR